MTPLQGLGLKAWVVTKSAESATPFRATVEEILNQSSELSAGEGEELRSLGLEKNSKLFWSELLRIGAKLESRDKLSSAHSIYNIAAQQAPLDFAKQAQGRLEHLEGGGTFGARVESHLRNFVSQALSPAMILPMMAGTTVFSVTKGLAMTRFAAAPAWWMQGSLPKVAASILGYLAEVPVFAGAARLIHGLSGDKTRASFGQELASSAITLGLLKSAGALTQAGLRNGFSDFLGRSGKFLASQAATFTALLAARKLEEKAGFAQAQDGFSTATDILASMLSLGIGARLGRRLSAESIGTLGQEFRLRSERAFAERRPFSVFSEQSGLALAGPSILMSKGEGESGGGDSVRNSPETQEVDRHQAQIQNQVSSLRETFRKMAPGAEREQAEDFLGRIEAIRQELKLSEIDQPFKLRSLLRLGILMKMAESGHFLFDQLPVLNPQANAPIELALTEAEETFNATPEPISNDRIEFVKHSHENSRSSDPVESQRTLNGEIRTVEGKSGLPFEKELQLALAPTFDESRAMEAWRLAADFAGIPRRHSRKMDFPGNGEAPTASVTRRKLRVASGAVRRNSKDSNSHPDRYRSFQHLLSDSRRGTSFRGIRHSVGLFGARCSVWQGSRLYFAKVRLFVGRS